MKPIEKTIWCGQVMLLAATPADEHFEETLQTVHYPDPSEYDQIAFFRSLICACALRNPVACGTNDGN